MNYALNWVLDWNEAGFGLGRDTILQVHFTQLLSTGKGDLTTFLPEKNELIKKSLKKSGKNIIGIPLC